MSKDNLKLIQKFTLSLILSLVLCGNTFSQSTFFLDEGEQLSLVYQDNTLHGFGVNRATSFQTGSVYERACEEALEDLNSNLFMSVFIEEFKSHDFSTYNFPELSVQDSAFVIGVNAVKVDSFTVDKNAYCVVTNTGGRRPVADNLPSLEKLMIGPQKVGNTWYAIGKSKATKFNPSLAWLKSKNDAIQEMTKTIRMSVQSLSRRIEEGAYDQSSEITYFKSNVIYKGIYNVRRYTTHKSFVTVVAINESDVIRY